MTLNEANSIMEQREKSRKLLSLLMLNTTLSQKLIKNLSVTQKRKKKGQEGGELKNEVKMALVTLLQSKKKRTIKNPIQKTSGRTQPKNYIVVKNNRKSR